MTDLAKNIWLHAIAIVAKARNKCAPGERFEALNLVMGDLEDARRRDQLIAPDFPAACPDCGQHCETHNGESDCAALQPGGAQGADPVAWQIKPLAFDWQPKDRGNPSEMIIQTDDYSAYVLIPYDKGHDPRAGIGTWNGVANHKGETGFPTREAAMRYCEDTIRADAERAVKKAMRWIEATPPAAQVTVADTIAALKAMPTRTEALGGQDFKYIQLGEALDTLRALAGDGK